MNKNTAQRKRLNRKIVRTAQSNIISESIFRNMRQIRYLNKTEGKIIGNCSLTSHEVINKNEKFQPLGKVSNSERQGKEKTWQFK